MGSPLDRRAPPILVTTSDISTAFLGGAPSCVKFLTTGDGRDIKPVHPIVYEEDNLVWCMGILTHLHTLRANPRLGQHVVSCGWIASFNNGTEYIFVLKGFYSTQKKHPPIC